MHGYKGRCAVTSYLLSLAPDYVWHFSLSIILVLGFTPFVGPRRAVLMALLVGLGKELGDNNTMLEHVKDLSADAVGCAVGYFICTFLVDKLS